MCWERVEYNTRWLVLVLVIARAFGYTQINCLDTIFPFAVISSFFPQYFLLSDSKRSLCSEFPMTSRVCRFVCRCVARSEESNTSNRVLQISSNVRYTWKYIVYTAVSVVLRATQFQIDYRWQLRTIDCTHWKSCTILVNYPSLKWLNSNRWTAIAFILPENSLQLLENVRLARSAFVYGRNAQCGR